MFNKASIKTDIALLLPMLAGLLNLFGITLNVGNAGQVFNDVLDALFIIVPMVLQVFRELQHLKLLGAPTSLPAAPSPPALPAT